jgi:hypothetical protein
LIGDRSKCESCINFLGLIEDRVEQYVTRLLVDCKVHGKVKALGPKGPPSRCKDYTAKGRTWTFDPDKPEDEWEWEEKEE